MILTLQKFTKMCLYDFYFCEFHPVASINTEDHISHGDKSRGKQEEKERHKK
jgi:hypothetical protein